jgi:hypothetical protein
MKPRRNPPVLAGRIPHDREECLGLHFSAGPSRDAARELWQLLEDAFDVNLRGLHPDHDALETVLRSGAAPDAESLGSFRRCAESFSSCHNALAKVEFIMSLEEAVYEPFAGRRRKTS